MEKVVRLGLATMAACYVGVVSAQNIVPAPEAPTYKGTAKDGTKVSIRELGWEEGNRTKYWASVTVTPKGGKPNEHRVLLLQKSGFYNISPGGERAAHAIDHARYKFDTGGTLRCAEQCAAGVPAKLVKVVARSKPLADAGKKGAGKDAGDSKENSRKREPKGAMQQSDAGQL